MGCLYFFIGKFYFLFFRDVEKNVLGFVYSVEFDYRVFDSVFVVFKCIGKSVDLFFGVRFIFKIIVDIKLIFGGKFFYGFKRFVD